MSSPAASRSVTSTVRSSLVWSEIQFRKDLQSAYLSLCKRISFPYKSNSPHLPPPILLINKIWRCICPHSRNYPSSGQIEKYSPRLPEKQFQKHEPLLPL